MPTWFSTENGEETDISYYSELPHGFYTASGGGSWVKGPFLFGAELDEDLAVAQGDNPETTLLVVDGDGTLLISHNLVTVRPDAIGASFGDALIAEKQEATFVTAMKAADSSDDNDDEITALRNALDVALGRLGSRWNSHTASLEPLTTEPV